jgi:hypothetical protein
MKARVTIKDTNNIDKIVKNLQKINGKKIKVGVFGGEKHENSEIDMADLASIHEFGCEIQVTPKMRAWFTANGYPLKKETTVIRIPERSFLRSGYDENIDTISKKIEEMVPDVIAADVDPKVFMDAIGVEFAGLIQKKMRDLKNPPNSQMTIERKGSSNPLIDTGRLVSSIRHEVE